jgi:hypothetical protein
MAISMPFALLCSDAERPTYYNNSNVWLSD